MVTRTATTANYKLTLDVGPTETMYTPAEVKAKHPKTGEVMIGGGSMNMGGSMAMGAMTRHLEVHVKALATGKVVTNVMPSISLTDTTSMGMAKKVDVVTMEGIGEGVSDFHYGNNVTLTAGQTYSVVVVIKGEKATFSFKA